MECFPQVLVNITVTNEVKSLWQQNEAVTAAINEVEQKLGGNGRVLVRASGTEPLMRVMLEGKNTDEITEYANKIANEIKKINA